jgi:hypothetical protein
MLFQGEYNICVIDQKQNLRNIELKKIVKDFPVLRRIFSLRFQKFDLNVSYFILSFNSFLFIAKFIIIRFFSFKLKRWRFSKAFYYFFQFRFQIKFHFESKISWCHWKNVKFMVNHFVLNFFWQRFWFYNILKAYKIILSIKFPNIKLSFEKFFFT